MREWLEFFYLLIVSFIIAYIIYPFAVIKSFITGKHESELETIGDEYCVQGCRYMNCGMLMVLLSVLLTKGVILWQT